MKKDYYRILKVNREAKPSQIKKAYRSAAKRYHPDISPRDEEKFKEIQEAYETLSDPGKRALYDQQDLETPAQHTRSYPYGRQRVFPHNPFDEVEEILRGLGDFWVSDLLDFLVEKQERRRQHAVEITLSPEEARRGCRIPLRISRWVNCTRCGGTGKTGGLICGLCRGQGEEKIEIRIRVEIPAGVKDGMNIRIPLRGPDLKEDDLLATLKVL